MTRAVVLVHGGWVTPACWGPFVSSFEARGYRWHAPAWPGKDRSVEEIRSDPSALAGLGIAEIVDHYERTVRSLDEPPILIGHSFGGLFGAVVWGMSQLGMKKPKEANRWATSKLARG